MENQKREGQRNAQGAGKGAEKRTIFGNETQTEANTDTEVVPTY